MYYYGQSTVLSASIDLNGCESLLYCAMVCLSREEEMMEEGAKYMRFASARAWCKSLRHKAVTCTSVELQLTRCCGYYSNLALRLMRSPNLVENLRDM